MDAFRFEPVLFNHRADAMEALSAAGFQWLSDFTAVDLLHDRFGLEVCGIAKKEDALKIRRILHQILPSWRFSYLDFKDGERDLGWKVAIYRDSGEETTLGSEA